ncbi:hypothetical protein [Blastopirellula marina]|uniref:Carboxypeptidase regulatory-like domain-containing protein n=1 Tax=Blastopirellula marina TaxID=124 RepID=A0A2S8GNX0_9BACT|nr:hypothetical protein [Blastopirellula marina]PQO46120.1 hypothetical protein C5Y93_11140 [Blastopirellula marina]
MLKHWPAGLLLLGSLLIGCGGDEKLVPASGQVLFNGEPLTFEGDGFIQVIPQNDRAATGAIDPSDGTFTLTTYQHGDGVARGEHSVTVKVTTLGPRGRSVSLLPDMYTQTATSGLTVTIDEPTDTLRIELTGKLRKLPRGKASRAGDDPGF